MHINIRSESVSQEDMEMDEMTSSPSSVLTEISYGRLFKYILAMIGFIALLLGMWIAIFSYRFEKHNPLHV